MRNSLVGLLLAGALSSHVAHADYDKGNESLAMRDYAAALAQYEACSDEARCQYRLGLMYASGHGMPKNSVEAVNWYTRAAGQGDLGAINELAFGYFNGNLGDDDAQALKWLGLASDRGTAGAMYFLGVMHEVGRGTAKSLKEAIKFYRMAADNGNARAQLDLADRYRTGSGAPKDMAESIKFYRMAAESEYPLAQYMLGVSYAKGDGVVKSEEEAVKWYRKAAEQGYPDAQFNLAERYRNGSVFKKDDAEAFKWYLKAAKQGHAHSQYMVGLSYVTGGVVVKNEEEAAKWYRRAADQGHAMSQSDLGILYSNGVGVEKNDAEAVRLFRMAADQGIANAQYNIGLMYNKGLVVAKDDNEAVRFYRLAADNGQASAQANLGAMYFLGRGVNKDLGLAAYWSAKAAQNGENMGAKNIEILRKQLNTLTVKSKSSVFEKPDTGSTKIHALSKGDPVYKIAESKGFVTVYIPQGHQVGYIESKKTVAVSSEPAKKPDQRARSPFPARPAAKPGVNVCATQCYNAQCYRTYSDGKQVQFTAKQVWDPFNNTFKFDSGGC